MKNNNMDLKDISFDESDKNLFQIDDLRLKADALNLEEIADFWDTHSVADFWEQTKEVEFEVRASRRRRITIEPDVYTKIQNCARQKGILPETLVNLWLVERLQQQVHA